MLRKQALISSGLSPSSSAASPFASISLRALRSQGQDLGLERWAGPGEFNGLVPGHFTEKVDKEGQDLLDSLMDTGGHTDINALFNALIPP